MNKIASESSSRELLELAAMAASFEVVGDVNRLIAQPDHRAGGFVIRNDRGGDSCWNPLTDDGDALRLVVKLGISPEWGGFDVEICKQHSGARSFCYVEPHGSNPYAATRLAIVRAAAAIAIAKATGGAV